MSEHECPFCGEFGNSAKHRCKGSLSAENATLRARVTELEREDAENRETRLALAAENDALEAACGAYRIALAIHASHGVGCQMVWAKANRLVAACDCGLDAALSSSAGTRAARVLERLGMLCERLRESNRTPSEDAVLEAYDEWRHGG